MNPASCCQNRTTLTRRFFALAQWILPGTILVVLPKCPACLAAYVLVWTGVGLSLSTASTLRTLIFVFSVTALVCLAARRLRLSVGAAASETKESNR